MGDPKETSRTISEWARETFGGDSPLPRIASRANEEMAELLTKVTSGASEAAIAEECADIAIVLARLADRCGVDLWSEVERKMSVNRTRVWRLDGTGCGQHKESHDPE